MKFNVIVSSPIWSLNGVNVFSANLVRELQHRGIPSEILLTQPHLPDPKPMSVPADIPVNRLPVKNEDVYGVRWAALIRYLEERAPCIYIPNHDIEHSAICPALDNQVAVVGVVHSDDPQHYEHVGRLGSAWNHIVTVSKTVANETLAKNPALADRLTVVPIGVRIPLEPPAVPSDSVRPLKLLYAGVFKQQQKRILDLPKIVQRLAGEGIPVTLTIAGGGPDEADLVAAAEPLVQQGLIKFIGIVPHDEMPSLLQDHDVFLMTSAYEGMPNALLEAMGQGCIPVVTDIDSGIPEVVTDGESGFLVPVGDIEQFAERITQLQRHPDLRQQLASCAYSAVSQGPYSIRAMADSYLQVFEQALAAAAQGKFQRPAGGKVIPPPHMRPIWRHYLPLPIYEAARLSRRTLRAMAR
ncbi:MAG: glycosyltransferase family 4 protein [Cyanobacteria bacterium P01_A01_bin.135]